MRVYNIFFFLIIFTSCKTYYSGDKSYNINSGSALDNVSKLELEDKLKINFKGDLNFEGNNFSINGFIKIESEDRFQIFIFSKTYGVEVARLDFYYSDLIYINKRTKSYYKGSIANFNYFKNNELTSKDLLFLLMGRNFIKSDLVVGDSTGLYSFIGKSFKGFFQLSKGGNIDKGYYETPSFSYNCEYESFNRKYNLPVDFHGKFTTGKNVVDFNITNYSFDSRNVSLVDFNIPDNFTKIL